MCIAIFKPQDRTIPDEYLVNSFNANPDGAGFMYAEDNQLHITKGLMTYDQFKEAYEPHQHKVAAIHFRIGTHGEINKENTHPFPVGTNMGVIHNGIINSVNCAADEAQSDTYHFNTQILQPLYKRDSRFAFKTHYQLLISEFIRTSKLVFLNNKGHHTIINEKFGNWKDDVWYSNNSYRSVINPFKMTPSYTKPVKPDTLTQGMQVTTAGLGKFSDNWIGVIQSFGIGGLVNILTPENKIKTIHQSFVYPYVMSHDFKLHDVVYAINNPLQEGKVTGLTGGLVHVEWYGKKTSAAYSPKLLQHCYVNLPDIEDFYDNTLEDEYADYQLVKH